MLNIVETFSGIGAQRAALKNANISHRVSATVEWEIGAIYAYDILHNGKQDLRQYRHHTRESLIEELSRFNLSSNGKEVASFQSINNMSMIQLKAIFCAIERNNNLVDITNVKATDLDDDIDLLTYSFPCQDLSVGSYWWNNTSGIDKNSGNRSSLLWEIERILYEFRDTNKPLPKFLLMENVSAILSKRHIDNFNIWCKNLENLGYVNQIYTLNSKNFGIPQGRSRTYMVSILVDNEDEKDLVHQYFLENNLERIILSDEKIKPIGEYLRLDYANKVYLDEAIEATPNFTPSREKIYNNNCILATDDKPNNSVIAKTITTKQDRNPNSGIVTFSKDNELVPGSRYRNITPREAFLLMGFSETEFDNLIFQDIRLADNRTLLPSSKLLKLAGNSIVVPVLEAIFCQVVEIKDLLHKTRNQNNYSSVCTQFFNVNTINPLLCK